MVLADELKVVSVDIHDGGLEVLKLLARDMDIRLEAFREKDVSKIQSSSASFLCFLTIDCFRFNSAEFRNLSRQGAFLVIAGDDLQKMRADVNHSLGFSEYPVRWKMVEIGSKGALLDANLYGNTVVVLLPRSLNSERDAWNHIIERWLDSIGR